MHHPQVLQSPIANYCMKVKIGGYTEPQLVSEKIFQVSVIELNNNLVIATNYSGLKKARDEDDNIIISDSTLRSLFPPRLKKCCQDTSLCVVVNVAYMPKLCIHRYHHSVIVNLKTEGSQPKCSKKKVWVKIKSHI